MPKKKNTSKSNIENEEEKNESLVRKKKDVEMQIAELQKLIMQIESNLGIHKFGEIKSRSKTSDLSTTSTRSVKKAVNLQQQSMFDMYRYAGFYCSKLTASECIFNFTSTAKKEPSNTYCIQIITENTNVVRLGKWVMPFSANMDKVLEETPLKEVPDISRLLKNCKQYIETFENRKRQYHDFKNVVEDARNCTLDSDWGYTRINLQLFGVYEKKSSVSRNLLITLLYNSKGTKPRKILIETLASKKLSDQEMKSMKSFLSPFYKHQLSEAFEVIKKNHPLISWTIQTSATDIAELRISSSEDEEDSFLSKIQSMNRSKTQAKEKKRRILKKIQDKKQKMVERSKTKENTSMTNISKNSIRSQETLLPEGNDDGSLIGHTTNSILKPKLRQTKLNFEVVKTSSNLTLDQTFVKPKESVTTSTPLRRNVKFNLPIEGLDISDITQLTNNNEKQKRVKSCNVVLEKLEEENEKKAGDDSRQNSMKIPTKTFYKNETIRRSPRKNGGSPTVVYETAIPRPKKNMKRMAHEETKEISTRQEIPSKIPRIVIPKYQGSIKNKTENRKPRVIREQVFRMKNCVIRRYRR